MCLVPEVLMSSSDTTINAEIQFYRDDLCHRLSVVVVELVRCGCRTAVAGGMTEQQLMAVLPVHLTTMT